MGRMGENGDSWSHEWVPRPRRSGRCTTTQGLARRSPLGQSSRANSPRVGGNPQAAAQPNPEVSQTAQATDLPKGGAVKQIS
ncbi:hypothetical protein PAAG_05515 [Paracoccidioides lutzii Pb01]|uniref:Uncharacterized protein n=1 Tax=Paracoccidioides lutzii (strain ATCC MYA-826 / Pb01) TaxID=502779 RepID=C1H422_PARBA|nr:hypothetical protein PAAG_05515 [Paracoccidioides lutzii Pb01]EEH34466.2 hypothetical protein PAAG_05515 [Paracoccidioides lutzii Pb01]